MQENFGASWEKYMRAQEATGKGHATNFQTHLNKMQASRLETDTAAAR